MSLGRDDERTPLVQQNENQVDVVNEKSDYHHQQQNNAVSRRDFLISQNVLREKDELKEAEKSMFSFIKVFVSKVRSMPARQLLFVFFLVALLTIGNAMQLIGINFWLEQFADGNAAGSYTILMMSGSVFALVFTAWLVVYIFVAKPDTHFMKDKRGWWLLFGVGVNDTVNSFMAIYAANVTPEVLQALFQTLLPIYACVMSKYILKDPRTYLNRWIIISFVLITAGVVLAAVPNFTGGTDSSSSGIGWSVVFFLSVPFTALQFVWQSKYMIDYTVEPKMVLPEDEEYEGGVTDGTVTDAPRDEAKSNPATSQWRLGGAAKFQTQSRFRLDDGLPGPPSPASGEDLTTAVENDGERAAEQSETATVPSKKHFSVRNLSNVGSTDPSPGDKMDRPYRGEDTIVKLTMLFGDVGFQLILSLLLLPADALPWWGGAHSEAGAWKHFSDGTREIFTDKKNFFYCAIYSGGYVMQYISAAYLNHYSATLSTMVSQLSSPFTALALIIIPSWDVTPGNGAWYWSAIAIVLLSVGTIIYSAWEEMSSQELALEMQEKERERRRLIKEGGVVAATAAISLNNDSSTDYKNVN